MASTLANTEPIFIGAPRLELVRLQGQILTRDGGSGSPALFWTAGENGSLIETIYIIPITGQVANKLRLFVSLPTGYQVISETDIPSSEGIDNPPQTQVSLPAVLAPASSNALRLSPSMALYVALDTAAPSAGFILVAQGGDY